MATTTDRPNRLQKQLGLLNVYALATGSTLSAGFFLLPGLAAEEAGPAVPLAYLIAVVPMIPAMFSMIELATAMPRAGGAYYFLDRSLGPLVGTIGGLGTWLALVLKTAFALIGMGAYIRLILQEVPWLQLEVSDSTLAVGFAIVFSLVNLRGAKGAAGFQVVLVSVLLVLLALLMLGLKDIHPDNLSGFLAVPMNKLLSTAGMVYISYVGVTKVASVSEEVRDPEKNLPLGVILALLTAVIVYGVGTLVMVGVLGAEAMADPHHEAHHTPVAAAARVTFGWIGALLMSVAAVAAFSSVANAGILSASRYPLAMSRDNLLPPLFAKLTGKGIPVYGVLVTGALILFLVTSLDVVAIAKLASAFQLVVFALLCLAVIIMRESRIESYDPGYKSPLYPWTQLLGIAAAIVLITEMGSMPQMFSLGLVVAGGAWYFQYARKRVDRFGAVFHIFERLGRQRYEGLDAELREIMKEKGLRDEDPFDEIVARAKVLEADENQDFKQVAFQAATLLDDRVPETPAHLLDGFLRDNVIGATPVADGVALPHLRIAKLEHPELVLVRSRKGIPVQVSDAFGERTINQSAHAIFFLVSPEQNPGQHLRILAQLAGRVEDEDFLPSWLAAKTEQELKESLLRTERFLSLRLSRSDPTAELIGKRLKELQLPPRCLVALVRRGDETFVPTAHTTLREGDRVTIIGEPAGIGELYHRYHPPVVA